MDKQSNSTTVPEISTDEHPWEKARRLSKELSATLAECGNADWFAHVFASNLAPNVLFGALPMGRQEDELAIDRVNRLAWDLSNALNDWNGGACQALILPSARGGNTVIYQPIKAWDRRSGHAPETPQEELRHLSLRVMEIVKEIDPRTETVTIRATAVGATVMTGFNIPIPGMDEEAA